MAVIRSQELPRGRRLETSVDGIRTPDSASLVRSAFKISQVIVGPRGGRQTVREGTATSLRVEADRLHKLADECDREFEASRLKYGLGEA